MLARTIFVGLLITHLHYQSCKDGREEMDERLIVNSRLAQDSLIFTFDKPIYMDMDGKLIEHGTMPASMHYAIFDSDSLQHAMAGSALHIFFTVTGDSIDSNRLYPFTATDSVGAVFTGEIRLNEKSYLTIQEKKY